MHTKEETKINIGIDIDGVINDLSLFHIACGTKFSYENFISTHINEQLMDSKDILGWSKNIDDIFWEQYYLKLLLYPDFIRPYASDATKCLYDKGHTIYIISSRKDADLPIKEKRSMYILTEKYLKNSKIFYSKLYLTENKWDIINTLNIDIMIEDHPAFFTHRKSSPLLFCFNTPYNQEIYGENIFRVYSWYDILEKINKMQGEKYEY